MRNVGHKKHKMHKGKDPESVHISTSPPSCASCASLWLNVEGSVWVWID